MSQRLVDQAYTAEEFEKMPEFNERYELINGRLVEKPMPRFQHSRIAKRIMLALNEFDAEEKLGVMLQEVSVEIRPDYAPAPDLSFWVASRKPAEEVDLAPYPDLAIEVPSKDQSRKKLIAKAQDYLAGGVSLVWLIDPFQKIVTVFHKGGSKPVTIQATGLLEGEDVIPGFELPVKALFE